MRLNPPRCPYFGSTGPLVAHATLLDILDALLDGEGFGEGCRGLMVEPGAEWVALALQYGRLHANARPRARALTIAPGSLTIHLSAHSGHCGLSEVAWTTCTNPTWFEEAKGAACPLDCNQSAAARAKLLSALNASCVAQKLLRSLRRCRMITGNC